MAQRSIYLFLRQPTLISSSSDGHLKATAVGQYVYERKGADADHATLSRAREGQTSSRRLNEGLPGEDRWIRGGSWGGERWMVEVLLAALVVVAECSSSLLVRIGTWIGSLLGQRLMEELEERPEDDNPMLRTTIHQWSRGDDTE
ncbi:hypothetical protein HYFRA_00009279 [Hymenoscyphus fraxineus]|uniref:Uncharacterized protein n=1 Tax=Hymenoscyphus fraxineus TaxID=746836 RepID=A0A9N9L2K5_9HELO|nr:hypothetical protein HYFRA_00009279 [Hymenoscyphus fraxineus]